MPAAATAGRHDGRGRRSRRWSRSIPTRCAWPRRRDPIRCAWPRRRDPTRCAWPRRGAATRPDPRDRLPLRGPRDGAVRARLVRFHRLRHTDEEWASDACAPCCGRPARSQRTALPVHLPRDLLTTLDNRALRTTHRRTRSPAAISPDAARSHGRSRSITWRKPKGLPASQPAAPRRAASAARAHPQRRKRPRLPTRDTTV
jgi:hypothetical protein